jgi:hypothetical protein
LHGKGRGNGRGQWVLLLYLATHRFNLSAGVGMAALPALGATAGLPTIALAYIAALFLSVPAKTILDRPRRQRIRDGRGGAS